MCWYFVPHELYYFEFVRLFRRIGSNRSLVHVQYCYAQIDHNGYDHDGEREERQRTDIR